MRLDSSCLQRAVQSALLTAACSVSLLTTTPALALPPTIEAVAVETSQAAYPILTSLDERFPPFTELIAKLILDIPPAKVGPAIGLGIDAFLSVPSEKIAVFESVVKDSFADLQTDSCTLVPLPPPSVASRFGAVAGKTVEQGKLQAFDTAWGGTLNALKKTDAAICLPPSAALDRLTLAQIEVGRGFGYDEKKRFLDYTATMLKGELSLTDEVLALANAAKSQAPDASVKQKNAFKKAGDKLESAAKREREIAALARGRAAAAKAI